MITVVTCYYIIPNKRSHKEYENWIKNFLKIPCNLYIFTDEKSIETLIKYRPISYNTYYHILPLEKFYTSKYDELWKHSLSIDIEVRNQNINHTVELYKIWAEKIFMCREAINNNVFNSQIFCWSDIGSVRYNDMFPRVFKFPNGLIKVLDKNKVMFSEVSQIQDSDYTFNQNGISVIFQNLNDTSTTGGLNNTTSCNPINRIQGGFFAGYINSLLKYADMYDKELELFNNTKTFAGKDQYIMTNIYLKNKDMFQLTQTYNKFYHKDEWFAYLLKFSDVPYITCDIKGGLGNQLFQISHTLCLAWKNNCLPAFEKIKPPIDISSRPSYWDSIFRNLFLIPSSLLSNCHLIIEKEFAFNEINKIETDIRLCGYWQSSKYFYGYNNKIRNLFAPSEIVKSYLINKIPSKCTAIHIRRSDYIKLKWNLPLEYYKICIEKEVRRDPKVNFLIFSDDHEWCKTNLPSIPIFNIGNEVAQLYALSLCNNVIMANSSFCWWGVFLNTTNEKRNIYAPEPWFPRFQNYNKNIYENGWIKINVNYS